MRVLTVRAEGRSDSHDVANPTPRLTWTTGDAPDDWTQARAEVELDRAETVALDGPGSVLVAWPFAPIAPRDRHEVRVRVTGTDGTVSPWSDPLPVVGAFLEPGGWRAEMVALADPDREAAPLLVRRELTVRSGLARATLYATAHGVYDAFVNGRDVDDQVMKPGWTPYRHRLVHETTDVTALLVEGTNVLGLAAAGGWYTERYGWRPDAQPQYGPQPEVAAQLVLEYADGGTEVVATGTGDGWLASGEGPVRASGLYDGEEHDARRTPDGWAEPAFDTSGWTPVVAGTPAVTPEARSAPAVRPLQELPVAAVLDTPGGGRVLDFGQNLVGRLRLRVRGAAGTRVTLRHAEVLEHGELGVRPLRTARATDTYVLRGDAEEVWEPRFTFHGFRYAEVTGLDAPLDPADVTAVVIHSDMRRTGWFTSSEPLLDRLHENVVWGMRGNFVYLPTDCPQRDERLGWTGDIQVFAPTASFLYDADAFLTSWLADLAIEQRAAGDGIVPFVVPNVLGDAATPVAAWGDAATVVPTVLHERYADREVLAAQYPSMRAWADCLLGLAGDRRLWEHGFQFGDWLDPTAPPHDAFQARTDPDLVATAHLFRSTDLVARAAALLGETGDAERYAAQAEAVRKAFLAEFVTANGRMVSDAQTAYALALVLGIARDDAQRRHMGDRLADLVRRDGYRIATGFVGTPLVCDALTVTGHLDAAARLLLQTGCPSWLYPVTMGATTIWERWDSMLEDGTINPGEMTSFNHYALGAVADWLHRTVAGVAPAEPGYQTLRLAPHPLRGLDHAEAVLDTPYGRAACGWRRTSGTDEVVVRATVPANTTAVVALPDGSPELMVGSGTRTWTVQVPATEPDVGPVDRETPLATVIDDVEAYDTVMATIEAADPALAQRVRRSTTWTRGAPLSQALNLLPGGVGQQVDAALLALSARRG